MNNVIPSKIIYLFLDYFINLNISKVLYVNVTTTKNKQGKVCWLLLKLARGHTCIDCSIHI
jgi:hypothetical protein